MFAVYATVDILQLLFLLCLVFFDQRFVDRLSQTDNNKGGGRRRGSFKIPARCKI